ncbi:MAG: hypothetical protein ACREQR_07270 [Candidatus Binataceae bacterium]
METFSSCSFANLTFTLGLGVIPRVAAALNQLVGAMPDLFRDELIGLICFDGFRYNGWRSASDRDRCAGEVSFEQLLYASKNHGAVRASRLAGDLDDRPEDTKRSRQVAEIKGFLWVRKTLQSQMPACGRPGPRDDPAAAA